MSGCQPCLPGWCDVMVPVYSSLPPGSGHRQQMQTHPVESGRLMLLETPPASSPPSTNLTAHTSLAMTRHCTRVSAPGWSMTLHNTCNELTRCRLCRSVQLRVLYSMVIAGFPKFRVQSRRVRNGIPRMASSCIWPTANSALSDISCTLQAPSNCNIDPSAIVPCKFVCGFSQWFMPRLSFLCHTTLEKPIAVVCHYLPLVRKGGLSGGHGPFGVLPVILGVPWSQPPIWAF